MHPFHIRSFVADFHQKQYDKHRDKLKITKRTSSSLWHLVGQFPKICHYSTQYDYVHLRDISFICFTSYAAHSFHVFLTLPLPFYPATTKFPPADTHSFLSLGSNMPISISLDAPCRIHSLLLSTSLDFLFLTQIMDLCLYGNNAISQLLCKIATKFHRLYFRGPATQQK